MTSTEPVHDWAEDFDIFDPRYVRDPYPIWDELRGRLPGRPHRAVGWLVPADHPRRSSPPSPTTSTASRRSRSRSRRSRRRTTTHGNRLRSIIATDPPDHTPERRLLLPFFAPEGRRALPRADPRAVPAAAARLRRARRGRRRRGVRQADPAAGHRRDPRHRSGAWRRLRRVGARRARARPAGRRGPREVPGDHRAVLPRRDRAPPRPSPATTSSPTSSMPSSTAQPVPMHVVRGNVSLMLIAGIDTTWSSIGSALWHLASTPTTAGGSSRSRP